MFSSMRHRALSAGVSVLLLLALVPAADGLRHRSSAAYASGLRYEDVYYLPPLDWVRVFSLGWHEASADLIWLRALVYFGDELRQGGSVRHAFDYTEAMLALDPDFRAAYRWIGVAGLYGPQAVTPDDVERAVAIMERGAARFPEDGPLAWDLGANLAFELAPILDDPDEKDRARARGLPHLMRAVRLGAAPEWGSLSNASLLIRIGRDEQAARHLEEMYLSVRDPATREQIAARIHQLRTRAESRAFVAAMEELERARDAELPYVSPELYPFVGPRPPVDLSGPIREGLPRAYAPAAP